MFLADVTGIFCDDTGLGWVCGGGGGGGGGMPVRRMPACASCPPDRRPIPGGYVEKNWPLTGDGVPIKLVPAPVLVAAHRGMFVKNIMRANHSLGS